MRFVNESRSEIEEDESLEKRTKSPTLIVNRELGKSILRNTRPLLDIGATGTAAD